MTEAEWLVCKCDPTRMIEVIGDRIGDRKLRLFAVACCRSILPKVRAVHLKDFFQALDVAERYCEGVAAMEELVVIHRETIPWDYEMSAAAEVCNPYAWIAALRTSTEAANCALQFWIRGHEGRHRRSAGAKAVRRLELKKQAELLRDIFGNPFRPAALNPAWLTQSVGSIAQGIYADQAFDRMPILGDALEEAGCAEEAVLDHCRQPGMHVRGCWVVDTVLGKS